MPKTIVAIVTDTHVGGSTALALPEFETDEGQLIHATRAQRWLYDCWLDYWAYVYALCKKHRARLVVVHLGDVIDGDHHQTVQALPNVMDQENEACELLEPYALKADKFFILRGTEAHAGEAQQNEVRIAARLGATPMWEGLLSIDGLLIDVAHHGRASRMPWTSSAAGMARQAQMTALEEGHSVPRYVFRGHNHTVDDSGEKVKSTRAIACPSWQLRTAFSYRVAPGTRSDIGGIVILPDGALDLSRLRYEAGAVGRTVTNV